MSTGGNAASLAQQGNPDTQDFDFRDDQGSGELSSVDYSYLYSDYYYEELVPEHHRFNALAKTTTPSSLRLEANPQGRRKPKSQRPNGGNRNNGVGSSIPVPKPPTNRAPQAQPNLPNVGNIQQFTQGVSPQINEVVPQGGGKGPTVGGASTAAGIQAGPFGYTDKGTFFTDAGVSSSLPVMIEVIYQGFVWALNVHYPDGNVLQHGGVHNILKDKVKREKVFLEGDHIVRVTGRASPFNINRLTFHTANGNTFGPWGDRRSEESTDFDVSAPAGHGLAFFSGTVDFGVPLRSVSFHWAPVPTA